MYGDFVCAARAAVIAEIRPALILRRDVSDESKPARSGRSILAAVAIVAGLWGIGVWVSSSIKYASVFGAVLLGSLLVFAAISAALLRAVRKLASSPRLRRSAASAMESQISTDRGPMPPRSWPALELA